MTAAPVTTAWRVASTHAVRFAAQALTVQTLEGPVAAGAGDAIVTGVRGEQWPVPLADFRSSYAPLGGLRFGEPGLYRRRSECVAAGPIAAGAAPRHRVAGGTLTGGPGDFVVRDQRGGERIVARDIFARTYVWDPAGRADPSRQTLRYERFQRDLDRRGASETALAGLGCAGAVLGRAFRRSLGGAAADVQRPPQTPSRIDELARRHADLADGAAIAAAGAGALAIMLAVGPVAVGLRPAATGWAALASIGVALLAVLAALYHRMPGWRARAIEYRQLADALAFGPPASCPAPAPGDPWWRVVAGVDSPDRPPAALADGQALLESIRERQRYYDLLAAGSASIARNGHAVAVILALLAGSGFVLAALSGQPALLIASAVATAWAVAVETLIATLDVDRRQAAAGAAAEGLGRAIGDLEARLRAGEAGPG